MHARYWVRWNSQHCKNCVSVSPLVENLKVKKVIKVSYLNQESRQVFRDSYASEYFTHPYICISNIFVLLICYRITSISRLKKSSAYVAFYVPPTLKPPQQSFSLTFPTFLTLSQFSERCCEDFLSLVSP